MLRKWDNLPEKMQNEFVKKYYDILLRKRFHLFIKRLFDIIMSAILIILLLPVMVIIAIFIKLDSKGEIIFKQIRVTSYFKEFKIYKFRTMCEDASKFGSAVTTGNDSRVTKIGVKLRKYRLDELPQLFNIFVGDMSFVGTRPEVVKYVNEYSKEMYATLLLPAGVTSNASIKFKDEDVVIAEGVKEGFTIDDVYIKKVLPSKMSINLNSIENFSFINDLKTMVSTVLAVLK